MTSRYQSYNRTPINKRLESSERKESPSAAWIRWREDGGAPEKVSFSKVRHEQFPLCRSQLMHSPVAHARGNFRVQQGARAHTCARRRESKRSNGLYVRRAVSSAKLHAACHGDVCVCVCVCVCARALCVSPRTFFQEVLL